MSDIEAPTCDWCLQTAPVERIQERLWDFWRVISAEGSNAASHRNICERCRLCYEDFLTYIETCKTHACLVEKIATTRVKDDVDSIDVEHHSLMKKEAASDSNPPTFSNGSSFKCSVCDETFTYADASKRHRHIVDKPLKCTACSVTFDKSLKDHVRVYTCSVCNKAFTRSNDLKRHMRVHTGERPFKCSLCNKVFSQSGTLKRHMRSHTGEKPFECLSCDKKFADSSNLKSHMRVHMDVKPFKCSVCNETCNTSECLLCDKSFSHSNSLKERMRLATRRLFEAKS